MFSRIICFIFLISTSTLCDAAEISTGSKLKIGVVGLTHTHVHWIFASQKRGDFEIVGIVEKNKVLAKRYAQQHGFTMALVFDDMAKMISEKKPEAVAAFGSIREHLEVVEKAASLGIHVMVEKPLAINMEHAKKMYALAKKHNIHLLTNYETTWYPSNHAVHEAIQENLVGDIRKVIVRDGHRGPAKLGIDSEFLDWLLDPDENGGGAIVDFGCYGANLLTWLMKGELPLSVTAVTQQLQKENNPKVDDEATILLTYENATANIQASWNWPIGRKDMEVYGLTGALYADNRNRFRIRKAKGYDDFDETVKELSSRPYPHDDPFSFFRAVIKNEIEMSPYDLSSLENNMKVMMILDAARLSAREGRTVMMNEITQQ